MCGLANFVTIKDCQFSSTTHNAINWNGDDVMVSRNQFANCGISCGFGYTNSVTFRRGKSSGVYDNIDSATGTVVLNNETRLFDPLYTAGTYYGLFTAGTRINVATNGYTIFDGRIADWSGSYEVTGRSVTAATFNDTLALLGSQDFDAWTTTVGQTASQRLGSVLDRSEVTAPAARSIARSGRPLSASCCER